MESLCGLASAGHPALFSAKLGDGNSLSVRATQGTWHSAAVVMGQQYISTQPLRPE